ncbi:hypothetical protein R3I94_012334 [Phoxinus phoxinus]
MEASKTISTDKATVVIQVNPQVTQNIVSGDDGQETRGAQHNTALTGFLEAQPKALGTVQIMIGVVIFFIWYRTHPRCLLRPIYLCLQWHHLLGIHYFHQCWISVCCCAE